VLRARLVLLATLVTYKSQSKIKIHKIDCAIIF